jgi:ribose 5-phosphate isomerase A
MDAARSAAVQIAVQMVEEGSTIGLGSGRAVFALAEAIGRRWPEGPVPVRAVAASDLTAERARAARIPLMDLTGDVRIDVAYDGADEVDDDLGLIKGGGAALLQEKLVIAAARRVVILVESNKQVARLGSTRSLPVEVVRFGWQTTAGRVEAITGSSTLRTDDTGSPVVTDEGHYLLDVPVPDGDLDTIASSLKSTLGVVDHGLFLHLTDELVIGHEDGTVTTTRRR